MNLNDLGYDLLGLGNIVFAAATDSGSPTCVGGSCDGGCSGGCKECKPGNQYGSQQ